MKKLARQAVAAILGYQVRKLCQKNNIKVIGVAGSIGKTSTKLAIAKVLQAGFRTRYQEGNYNDLVTVPLVFFGQELPSLFNPLAWLRVFWENQKQLKRAYLYDVVVVELGSDGPRQIAQFKKYLKLEAAVVTAVTPEHMEFFSNLDEVAHEEFAVADFSSLILANSDLIDKKYLSEVPDILTYSLKAEADFRFNEGSPATISAGSEKILETTENDLSEPQQYSLLAAVAIGYKLGMNQAQLQDGIKNIGPVPGRMQVLKGISGSTIIDDSYNSSPEAVRLALDYLYKLDAPQKIVLLGNMNELGDYSPQAHKYVAQLCDPKQIDLLVTLGPDANKYLAPAAEAVGCNVRKFDSPYVAGDFIRGEIKPGAAILIKGSQNKVFAEEAIKSLLVDPADQAKLVRQSDTWMKKKADSFKG